MSPSASACTAPRLRSLISVLLQRPLCWQLPCTLFPFLPNSTAYTMFALSAAFVVVAATLAHAQCPDYNSFSRSPQGNPSSGPLALPFMRPSEDCRTFKSPAVEVRALLLTPVRLRCSLSLGAATLQKVIEDMKARIRDPDLARLFENTFPNVRVHSMMSCGVLR